MSERQKHWGQSTTAAKLPKKRVLILSQGNPLDLSAALMDVDRQRRLTIEQQNYNSQYGWKDGKRRDITQPSVDTFGPDVVIIHGPLDHNGKQGLASRMQYIGINTEDVIKRCAARTPPPHVIYLVGTEEGHPHDREIIQRLSATSDINIDFATIGEMDKGNNFSQVLLDKITSLPPLQEGRPAGS